jgi:hypothetical protein
MKGLKSFHLSCHIGQIISLIPEKVLEIYAIHLELNKPKRSKLTRKDM